MENHTQKEKIASYTKVEIARSKSVNLLDIPGDYIVSLVNSVDDANFDTIPSSSIDFTDKKEIDNNYCQQTATIVISGSCAAEIKLMSASDVLFRLTKSDGDRIVVGNNEYPVRFQIEESGKPIATRLTFDHKHPEHAKILV